MSVLWMIRISLITILVVYLIIYRHILKHKKKYSNLLENKKINLFFVVIYHFLCYLPVILPSDSNIIPKPLFFCKIENVIYYLIVGGGMCLFGFFVFIEALKMRKVAGSQDIEGILLTNRVYSLCRHPIYFGISMMCLGLPLILIINFDGLLVFPIILLINILMGKNEEVYDFRMRFKDDYPEYKNLTSLFGSKLLWSIIVLLFFYPIILLILFTLGSLLI